MVGTYGHSELVSILEGAAGAARRRGESLAKHAPHEAPRVVLGVARDWAEEHGESGLVAALLAMEQAGVAPAPMRALCSAWGTKWYGAGGGQPERRLTGRAALRPPGGWWEWQGYHPHTRALPRSMVISATLEAMWAGGSPELPYRARLALHGATPLQVWPCATVAYLTRGEAYYGLALALAGSEELRDQGLPTLPYN